MNLGSVYIIPGDKYDYYACTCIRFTIEITNFYTESTNIPAV
ncbi:hypothetical protein Cst_c19150 [Thermoclostridium stercorarium subsp. stercorarium DSM 8532]|uniref:Uncharacterized protein n=1 Tax=Thermoclostridium stercorarium (strain ATCC 35414 / DSM 8532 / NCIMB 11754) TaxID=1121335 RepID=L7VQ09_THES1|nr:hypothetical protein Cst_c19150 [Thermoclostridium stercorarium subsp. stercorarium DSM 8532]